MLLSDTAFVSAVRVNNIILVLLFCVKEYDITGKGCKTVVISIEAGRVCIIFVKKIQKYRLLYVKLLKKCGIVIKLRDISFEL